MRTSRRCSLSATAKCSVLNALSAERKSTSGEISQLTTVRANAVIFHHAHHRPSPLWRSASLARAFKVILLQLAQFAGQRCSSRFGQKRGFFPVDCGAPVIACQACSLVTANTSRSSAPLSAIADILHHVVIVEQTFFLVS